MAASFGLSVKTELVEIDAMLIPAFYLDKYIEIVRDQRDLAVYDIEKSYIDKSKPF